MTLHPQVKAVLEQMAAMNLPELWSLTPEQARAQYAQSRLLAPDEPVARVEELSIPGPAGNIPARLYSPSSEPSQPAVVYFHGGGWVIGNLETHDYVCRLIANGAKCTVISVDYRLAPEHKFPAAADDAYAATKWVSDSAAELNVDSTRIAVAGDSAGGNVAAVVALMARDRGGPSIMQQTLVYPVIDHNFGTVSYRDNAEGYFLTTNGMRWFWAHYLASDADGANPYASPLRAETLAGLPPALVISAEYDPLRDEDAAYAERLRADGVDVTYTRYDGQVHGFFQTQVLYDDAKAAMRQVCETLRAAFEAKPAVRA
jgi:acetyl esterase